MIGRLVGRVVHEEPTGALLVDVNGVGYELSCPVGTATRAVNDGGRVTVFVHTVVRQDALELFGFSATDERAAFRLLITVPNVGPRLALAVLNVLPAAELSRVIDAEDKARLAKVPGIGKKTSERLVLELRGKMPRVGLASDEPAPAGRGSGPTLNERLVVALTGLGYRSQEAEKAAQALAADGYQETELSALLRQALKYLAP